MPKSFAKKALVTSNTRLTDTDGKSLRVLGLAELLTGAGFKTTLVVSECTSKKVRKFSTIETNTRLRNTLFDNILRKTFHFGRELISLSSFYAKLLIQGGNYDVVLSTLVGPEIDSFLACAFSKIKRTRFIYDYDDPSPEIRMVFYKRGKNDLRVKLSLFSRNMLVRNASLVLTSADTTKYQIRNEFRNTKRVIVWYNLPRTDDIYMHENKEHLRSKLGLSTKSFIASYLGNVPNWAVETLKNTLIHCIKSLTEDDNVLFLIIGGGIWEERYRKWIEKLHLTDRILVTGRQPRRSALEYLVASDVSLFPFELNSISMYIVPTKLFEAMALGIPVLCPRLPNFLQILGDEGIYFDDMHDLAERIRWCMINPEKLDKISSNLKMKYLGDYSWEKRRLSIENSFREVLTSS